MVHKFIFFGLVLTLFCGCSVDDEDRCPDGFVYVSDNRACMCAEGSKFDSVNNECVVEPADTEGDTDTGGGTDTDTGGGTDTDMDAGGHAGDAGAEMDSGGDTDTGTGTDTGDAPAEGFGEYCTSSDDCVDFSPGNFCAIDPTTQDGYCTVENCVSEDCPEAWQCCDCSGVPIVGWFACVTDSDADFVSTIGCSCS
ncbi:MAG: hypothetical protein GY854_31600 [Deltaproteobacteria bacterium]|nr:hypothetical protein [Deltaproteobacteria bacterium]